ncbi:hypothetical protein NC651_032726 [Populus alba x Populus x berolinensis]|nr:hypothetical protein NC651_032726 [Populus alba x Populus x berolinensis]
MACKVVERTCIYGNTVKRDREKWVSSFLLHFHLDLERKISKLIRGSDQLAVGTWKNTEEKKTRPALPALPLHFMPLRLRFNNCFSTPMLIGSSVPFLNNEKEGSHLMGALH